MDNDYPLISVVIPVYNSEKYLKKCINSISRQTYTNLEILIINDGSNDRSLKICERLACFDSRIRIICNSNHGVSYSRNCGIDYSTGELIMFVDSDDWLPKNSVEILYCALKNSKSLLSCGSSYVISSGRNSVLKFNDLSLNFSTDERDIVYSILHFIPGICGKLYYTELIKKKELRFSESVKSGEDTIFVLNYMSNCDSVVLVSDYVYYYNKLNSSSATKRYYDDFNKWMLECIGAYSNLCSRYKNDVSREIVDQIAIRYCDWMCRHYIQFSNHEREQAVLKIQDALNKCQPFILQGFFPRYENQIEAAIANYYKQNQGSAESIYNLILLSLEKSQSIIKTIIKRFDKAIKEFYYYKISV